jgi:hypothetical protein
MFFSAVRGILSTSALISVIHIMLSGIEVSATVIALFSAYSSAHSLYFQWLEKRRADREAKGGSDKRQSNDEVALMKTLSSSGSEIQKEYERGYRNLGGLFARGDSRLTLGLFRNLS